MLSPAPSVPVNVPLTACDASLVMKSLFEPPVSSLSAVTVATEAGATVSSVKLSVAAAPSLPAVSTWRTSTVLLPSTGVNDPVQVAPLLIEYWIVPPVSAGVTVNVPLLVISSLALLPVSSLSATVGAAGATVSSV